MRKPFATTIEESVQESFRQFCKDNKQYGSMNDVLEKLMQAVTSGEITIQTTFRFTSGQQNSWAAFTYTNKGRGKNNRNWSVKSYTKGWYSVGKNQ